MTYTPVYAGGRGSRLGHIWGFRVLLVIILALIVGTPAAASGYDRTEVITVEKTGYIWIVGTWGFEKCRIITDAIDTIPQYADLAALCAPGTTALLNDGVINLYYLGQYTYTQEVINVLPPIIIETDYKAGKIIITAIDTMPGHKITSVQATINGIPSMCDDVTGSAVDGGLTCRFVIYNKPAHLTAIAYSDYGDSWNDIEFRIGNRVLSDFLFSDNYNNALILGGIAYAKYNIYYDVPLRWGVLPTDPIPAWLSGVPVANLETDHYYYYLAGQVIINGFAAAPGCLNSGLTGGYATNCGLLKVFPVTYTYQNAYNYEITAAAAAWGVPNSLIKRVIAVESQFWPTALGVANETGLYQITRSGADTLLRWNGSAYLELCNLYFNKCDFIPYDNLATWQRDILTNHILNDPNNINYLAAALKANAYQVNRLIENQLNIYNPGEYLSYVDMWRITIGNYHTGALVTAAALDQIKQRGELLSWDSYAAALGRVSNTGTNYISMVTLNK